MTNALAGAGAAWTDITSPATLPTGRSVTAIGVEQTPLVAYSLIRGFLRLCVCVDTKGAFFRTIDAAQLAGY